MEREPDDEQDDEHDLEHLIDRLHEAPVGTEDPNIAGPDEPQIESDDGGGVAEAGGVPPTGS